MTRPTNAKALQGADGICRKRRRKGGGAPAWVRPFQRVRHALLASERLVRSSLRTAAASGRRARRRPIRASRDLDGASAVLMEASERLERAALALAETGEAIAGEPYPGVPALLIEVTRWWVDVAVRVGQAADDVFTLHENVLHALETGELVPERPAERRPRIVLAPRPTVRAFLRARRPRVADRIASILRRRRRIPRPAALRVPQRGILGRAPPRSPVCTL